MTNANLGSALRDARTRAHLSQTDVAHAVGWTSAAVLCNYEVGRRNPAPDTVERILEAITRLSSEGVPARKEHPILAIREAAGFGRLEVAREAGLQTSSRLHRYEAGYLPVSPHMLDRILTAINRLAAKRGRP